MLFPTELIGSYALPAWLWLLIERLEHGDRLGEIDIEETLEDAQCMALGDQESVGLDVVTDGEMRRRDFIQSFYGLLTGLNRHSPKRALGAAGYDQNPRYEVVERLTAPRGLGIVGEVEFLKRRAKRPFKVCVPGPITLSLPLILKGGYADRDALLADTIAIVNAEMKALVAAGADYLQVDEPRYATTHEAGERLVEIFNATRAGVAARVGLHICFGNFRGRSHDRRDYAYVFPALDRAKADQINLEFANREFAQIELLARYRGEGRIGIGVVDVKSYFVETAEEVAQRIRLAAKHAPPDRLVVTPDCGFNHTPRHIALRKIRAMAEGAALARASFNKPSA